MIEACPKCGKRIKDIAGFSNMIYPVWACDCKVNPADYAEPKPKQEIDPQELIRENYKNCRIDKFFFVNDFKVFSKELIEYYNNSKWIREGKQLCIIGNPGTCKTGQVTCICKKAIDDRYSVLYYRATEIPYQRDYEKIRKVDLLVLDNFARNNFENSRGALFDLLDYRIHNYLSNILITNVGKDDIQKVFDPALYDRLKLFVKIYILGKTQRKEL